MGETAIRPADPGAEEQADAGDSQAAHLCRETTHTDDTDPKSTVTLTSHRKQLNSISALQQKQSEMQRRSSRSLHCLKRVSSVKRSQLESKISQKEKQQKAVKERKKMIDAWDQNMRLGIALR